MNTDQASQALGIGQNAILDAIKRGTLQAEKVGRSWEITEEEVARYRVEHLGKQGRVSKEQATQRAQKARLTVLRNQEAAVKTARQHKQDGAVTVEDASALGQFLNELAEVRRELREAREARRQPQDADQTTVGTPVVSEHINIAQEELTRWVRKAEAVALRLEAVAARMEVSANT